MPSDSGPRVAYVVDLDENDKPVRGSKRSANTRKAKVSYRDSISGKTRKPISDIGSDDDAHTGIEAIATEKEGKKERRKSALAPEKSLAKDRRPPSAHTNRGFPKITMPTKSQREDPSHFGIQTPTTRVPAVVAQPIPMRPRAVTTQTYPHRPLSHHSAYPTQGYAAGPPLSASAFYQPSLITPSYPPSSPSYLRYSVTPQQDYFNTPTASARPLSSRFDPITRTTSAFGVRDVRPQPISDAYDSAYYDDGYASTAEGVGASVRRRESIRVPSRPLSRVRKAVEDAQAMPPPARPGILRRRESDNPYAAPDTDDYGRPRYHDEGSLPRRPSTNRNSVSYDLGKDSERVRVEAANNGRRRQSYYGQSASTGSSGYEDKVREATSYQEDVGGPSIPLTAEVLRRQQRRQAGSSRSTKSSGSHSRDESDYRKSATTRTTRSGSGPDDENVTIKVTGQARVMVGGAQIDCIEGGEIEIKRQKSIRNGSERSISEFGDRQRIDDRRSSRGDRPLGRSRMSSTHSYTRSTPHYPMGNYI
jgi:hypothetical protein